MSKVTAIVLAAGSGTRMKSNEKKQFMKINGMPILWYSLDAFEKSPVDEIILVTSREDQAYCKTEIVHKYGFKKVREIIAGGKERYNSVYNGLKAIYNSECQNTISEESRDAGKDIVLIHDGARPMITEDIIRRNIEEVKVSKACVTGVPVKDTIKIVEEGRVVETLKRDSLWITQTPQSFETLLIKDAYDKMMQAEDNEVTDDAMVAEKYSDVSVHFVMGDYKNIKITTPEDIVIAEAFLFSKKS